jgi:hypothetical protein
MNGVDARGDDGRGVIADSEPDAIIDHVKTRLDRLIIVRLSKSKSRLLISAVGLQCARGCKDRRVCCRQRLIACAEKSGVIDRETDHHEKREGH